MRPFCNSWECFPSFPISWTNENADCYVFVPFLAVTLENASLRAKRELFSTTFFSSGSAPFVCRDGRHLSCKPEFYHESLIDEAIILDIDILWCLPCHNSLAPPVANFGMRWTWQMRHTAGATALPCSVSAATKYF